MQKRGVSQVDWVISLAIFLLYIAWFFIFIRPLAVQNNVPNLVDSLKSKIHEDAYWTVLDYPIIIESNFSLSKEPIVAGIDFINQSDYFIINRSFFFVADKLFFLDNVSPGTDVESILNSNETYEPYRQITDLIATNASASGGGLQATIENNMLGTADFDGPKIFSYQLYSNSVPVTASNITFSNSQIAALYPINTQRINATTMVFAYNPRIYTLFQGSSSISEKFEINKYENYYFNSNNRGSLNTGGCYNGNSDSVEFYTGNSVMLFAFPEPVDISLCGNNYSITLNIDFSLSRTFLQKIIFYEGDYLDEKYKNPYAARVGIPNAITGLSFFNLQRLNATSYDAIKNRWNLGDFRISVTNNANNTNIMEVGGVPYEKATVYAEESRDYLLDKFGSLQDVKISIQGWT